jgi:hypothetical protein
MARPAGGDDSRTEVITVRVTKSERMRLAHRAATAGMTLSAWAAQALATGRVTVETRTEPRRLPPELVVEFKRIGNNVNQIAHALNARSNVRDGTVARQFVDFLRLFLKDEFLKARGGAAASAMLKAASRNPT